MEASRRRTVLSEFSGGLNAQSSGSSMIPVPQSAMKKQVHRVPSNSRLSEMPRPSQSSQGNGAQNGNVLGMPRQSRQSTIMGQPPIRGGGMSASQEGRRSTMMSQRGGMGPMDAGMSAGRGDAGVYGRTPNTQRSMPASVGRQSLYGGGGGRQSMAPLVTTGRATTSVDIRPIRDESFKALAEHRILSFLRENRCPVNIDERFFNGKAATKDVHEVIKWLVKEFLDQGRVWDAKKNIDDIQTVLKDLRYPYQGSITRTMIETAGSGQGWATMCAFIDWLVELCKAHTHWTDQDIVSDPIMMPIQNLAPDYEFYEDRLLWEYMARSYSSWFNHSMDDDVEAQASFEEAYDKLALQTLEENKNLSIELESMTAKLQQLRSDEPPLKKCQAEHDKMKEDQKNLILYIEKLQAHKKEKSEQRDRIRKATVALEENIVAAREELKRIEASVAAQNLSQEEVMRMTQQPELLKNTRADLQRQKEEAQKHMFDLEFDNETLNFKIEENIAKYMSLARQIGAVEATHEELRRRGLDPSVEYELDQAILANGVDQLKASAKRLRSEIWPAFQNCKERYRRELDEVEKANIGMEGEHDELCQARDSVAETVKTAEMQLEVTNSQVEADKQTFARMREQMMESLAKRQAELKDMLSASQQGVLLAQSELERTEIEFREVRYKTSLLQKSVLKQIDSHIDVIIKAKEHTANSVKSVRVFAENH